MCARCLACICSFSRALAAGGKVMYILQSALFDPKSAGCERFRLCVRARAVV
jgi:hypothetical protein